MASPHVAGTVALMWSAAPSLVGDIALTRQLLDDTAVDTEDLSCGGTADDNNVWGEGRLDAFAAVGASPRGPVGTLTGTVTDASSGSPIEGAAVHAAGPSDRTTFTGADGSYSITLPVGTYDVTASHFGYLSETASGVTVTEGATTTQDFALAPAPSHTVSGHVRDGDGNPLAGATVTIQATPLPPATTDASGAYSFASVPEGEYDVTASAGGCYETQTGTWWSTATRRWTSPSPNATTTSGTAASPPTSGSSTPTPSCRSAATTPRSRSRCRSSSPSTGRPTPRRT
jgi:hypothetical protein